MENENKINEQPKIVGDSLVENMGGVIDSTEFEIGVVDEMNDLKDGEEHDQIADILGKPIKEMNIKELESALTLDVYSKEEREHIRSLLDYYYSLIPKAFSQETAILRDDIRAELRQKRLEMKRKEKDKAVARNLHFKKIAVRVGLILLLSGSAVGVKVYYDSKIKPIKIINEKYAFVPYQITVKDGQTLTSIAKEIYASYPPEVTQIRTIESIVNEIAHMNHLEDTDYIQTDQILYVPTYQPREETKEAKTHQ